MHLFHNDHLTIKKNVLKEREGKKNRQFITYWIATPLYYYEEWKGHERMNERQTRFFYLCIVSLYLQASGRR